MSSAASSSSPNAWVSKIAALRDTVQISEQEKYVALAAEAQQQKELESDIDTFLQNTASKTTKMELHKDYVDYFFVLTEWFKWNIPNLQILLVRHIPTFLSIHLNKSPTTHPLVMGALLCLYNCEVLVRKEMQKRNEAGDRFFCDPSQLGVITASPLYNHEQIIQTLNSQKAFTLTAESLKNLNEKQSASNAQQSFVDTEHSKAHDLDFINDVKAGSSAKFLKVILQLYQRYLDVVGDASLSNFCNLVPNLLNSGMPYYIPPYSQLLSMVEVGEDVQSRPATIAASTATSTATTISMHNGSQSELELADVTIEEVPSPAGKEKEIPFKIKLRKSSNHLDVVQGFIAQASLQSVARPKTPSNNTATATATATVSNRPSRIILPKTVLNEMLSVIRYCVFSKRIGYDALISVHVRANYELLESILLHTQAILYELPLSK